MKKIFKAKDPFIFSTRFNLSESTGIKASTVLELLMYLRSVPGSCIYHHTHRILEQHIYLSPEAPNDFAYWIASVIGDSVLSEQIASINIVEFDSITSLREKFCRIIENYLEENPYIKVKMAPAGKEFYFIKSVGYVLPTGYSAGDLKEFKEILEKVDISSMYHHIFEARLRLENSENDFSNWFEHSLGEKELADKISKLDPYCYALEDLRGIVVKMIEKRLEGGKNDKN
jgi:hypothetical protein